MGFSSFPQSLEDLYIQKDMMSMSYVNTIEELIKAKRSNAFNMVASMFLGDVGVIGCTSKVIVPIK